MALIEGEALASTANEVVFHDPLSSATCAVTTVRIDSGLSWLSACTVLQDALRDASLKATSFGGYTGFWKQARSNRIILAIEMASTSSNRKHRMHRVFRPTLHTSCKPQYLHGVKLVGRYICLRDKEQAQNLWVSSYHEGESTRVKDVHLLWGAILPVWNALCHALRSCHNSRELFLPVRKCFISGRPLIGIALTRPAVAELKRRLACELGGCGQAGWRNGTARQASAYAQLYFGNDGYGDPVSLLGGNACDAAVAWHSRSQSGGESSGSEHAHAIGSTLSFSTIASLHENANLPTDDGSLATGDPTDFLMHMIGD